MMDVEAGRETDALIAEKVMGWVWVRAGALWEGTPMHAGRFLRANVREAGTIYELAPLSLPINEAMDRVKPYSTELAAAWPVVEWFVARGAKVSVMNRYAPMWGCMIIQYVGKIDERTSFETAVSPALAICRSALDAIKGAPDQKAQSPGNSPNHPNESAAVATGHATTAQRENV